MSGFNPPKRPTPERPPSEAGTLAGFSEKKADIETAHDLFETIKLAKQKSQDRNTTSSSNETVIPALPELIAPSKPNPLLEYLKNPQVLTWITILGVVIGTWAFITSRKNPTDTETKPTTRQAAPVDKHISDELKPRFSFDKPVNNTVTRASPPAPVTAPRTPPPIRTTPPSNSGSNSNAHSDYNDEAPPYDLDDPPVLLDDFRVEPAPGIPIEENDGNRDDPRNSDPNLID